MHIILQEIIHLQNKYVNEANEESIQTASIFFLFASSLSIRDKLYHVVQ